MARTMAPQENPKEMCANDEKSKSAGNLASPACRHSNTTSIHNCTMDGYDGYGMYKKRSKHCLTPGQEQSKIKVKHIKEKGMLT